MNRFKKFEESNLLQDIDFALKTQEFTFQYKIDIY